MMLRQGDVLLVPIDALPEAAVAVAAEWRDGEQAYVLAHGEATGHAHAVRADAGVSLYSHSDRGATGLFLKADGDRIVLRHEEHGPLTVTPGCYRVVRQRRYDPGRDPHSWPYVRD